VRMPDHARQDPSSRTSITSNVYPVVSAIA